MKTFFVSMMIAASTLVAVAPVEAATIGRSVSISPSRSFSSPSRSFSTPSKVGGIGGSSGSVGVRKSDITSTVKPTNTPAYTTPHTPAYVAPTTPVFSSPSPAPSSGGFWSSFGGSFAGSSVSNMLFRPSTPVVGSEPVMATGATSAVPVSGTYAAPLQTQSSYGIGSFILDVIMVVFAVGVIGVAAWLLYKWYVTAKAYIKKEREAVDIAAIPFNPMKRFWEIQDAFSSADKLALNSLLGADLADEITRNLEPSVNDIGKVSYVVIHNTVLSISVHYTFVDGTTKIDQVWHFDRHGGEWLLNGIENV